MNKLVPLKFNIKASVYSPLQGADVIVRRGLPQSDDSFIAAVLCAYEVDFAELSETERDELVSKFKKTITPRLTEARWAKCKSLMSKMTFKGTFLKELVKTSETLKKEFPEKEAERYELIFEMVKLNNLKTIINEFDFAMAETVQTISNLLLAEFTKYTNKQLQSYTKLSVEKQKAWLLKFSTLMTGVSNRAVAHTQMLYNSKYPLSFQVDDMLIHSIQNELNRDIYIIDASDRLPSKNFEPDIKKRKSLMILDLSGDKYEPLGKLINISIVSDFYPNDPLIKRIHTFKYKPELVYELYPNLLQYLPEQYSKLGDKFMKKTSHSPKRRILFKKAVKEPESSSD